jgi:hypothetical protein
MHPERGSSIGEIPLPVRRLHVELTSRCNFSCEFCPDGKMSRPRGTMEFPLLERILSDAAGAAREVHFHVMGEPALYPRLGEAVGAAAARGFAPSVTTNGSLLSPGAAGDLAARGLAQLTVSVQTPDPESFRLRGAYGLTFREYRERVVDTSRSFLSGPGGTRLTLVFLTNPLRRFLAPDPPRWSVPETGGTLRTHLSGWAEEIVRGTPHEKRLPEILRRIRKAGVLKESVIPVSDRVDFRVRILGNWAEHFELPIVPAKFGYCPGLVENFGILWNGDYVICCTDFEGRTVLANHADTPIREFLASPEVQAIAAAFRRFRVRHPHCATCLGERGAFDSALRQFGSIVYFKVYRKVFERAGHRGAEG